LGVHAIAGGKDGRGRDGKAGVDSKSPDRANNQPRPDRRGRGRKKEQRRAAKHRGKEVLKEMGNSNHCRAVMGEEEGSGGKQVGMFRTL